MRRQLVLLSAALLAAWSPSVFAQQPGEAAPEPAPGQTRPKEAAPAEKLPPPASERTPSKETAPPTPLSPPTDAAPPGAAAPSTDAAPPSGSSEPAGSPESGSVPAEPPPKAPPLAPPPRPSAPEAEEPDQAGEPELPFVPPAPDSLGGHFAAALSAAVAVPFGGYADDLSTSDLTGVGAGFGLELGFGVSRSVVLGLWGQFATLSAGSECDSCSSRSMAGGAFIRYHLVQGTRFDPWLAAGIGYRFTSIDADAAAEPALPETDPSFSGVEWARLQVGGDWYAFDFLGFGPFLELDMGVFTDRPQATSGNTAHFQFLTGMRIALDIPGR